MKHSAADEFSISSQPLLVCSVISAVKYVFYLRVHGANGEEIWQYTGF